MGKKVVNDDLSDSIIIRSMNVSHLKYIHNIETHSFTTPWSLNSFEKELQNVLAKYIVALYKKDVVGYAGIWHVLDEGHITNIAVHKNHRGCGIGRRLVSELINMSYNLKLLAITLEVRQTNMPAISLYRSLGFLEKGIRKGYYEDTKEDAIIMWKYLDEVATYE